jgi:hypothetical protein
MSLVLRFDGKFAKQWFILTDKFYKTVKESFRGLCRDFVDVFSHWMPRIRMQTFASLPQVLIFAAFYFFRFCRLIVN